LVAGVGDTITNLKEQRKLLEARVSYTSKAMSELSTLGEQDLVEEYDSDQEKKWRGM